MDFNGAQLLYFASYHEFIDRAEWERSISPSPSCTTTERELFYFANMNPGDNVLLQFASVNTDLRPRFSHHCKLFRASDRRLMAEIFTWKSG